MTRITVGPFWTNVLDLVGRSDLIAGDGRTVTVRRSSMDFVVEIEGKEVARTNHNLSASYFLNQIELHSKEG